MGAGMVDDHDVSSAPKPGTTFDERYIAAVKEMDLADEEWKLADRALACANARLHQARNVLNRMFDERFRQVSK